MPSYANNGTSLTSDGSTTVTWSDNSSTENLPYLYEWNMVDNTYTVQSGTTYPFKSMHAYMVQYAGNLHWSNVNATPPSSVAPRRTEKMKDVEFRIELQQGEQTADQTFVRLSNEEEVSANFDFNHDLCKEMNAGKANVYTIVEGYIQAAGNCLPTSEQTTVVPVGVTVTESDDYTFAIPDGTEGVGVTLIDTERGIRTNLSALDYTVSLEAGTYDSRFVLEISPVHKTPTDVEQSAISGQQSGVRKVMIDGLLYIVRDGKMFDARGARVE